MSNSVFPTLAGRGWDIEHNPQFHNIIHEAVSGNEVRVQLMSYPKYEIVLKYGVLRAKTALLEFQQIFNFFLLMQGSWDSFLFNSWWDNAVLLQPFGTGDGATTQFQLVRQMYAGGFTEPVMNLNGAASIYKAGVLQTLTTHYTINSTGMVTFVTAPANGNALTWSGSYYYRCRFKDDVGQFKNFMNLLWDIGKCQFVGCLGNKI